MKKSFAALLIIAAGCGPECSDKIVGQSLSPDGKYQATAFIRDCGATTDFSPQVYLCPKGGKVGDVGNVFIGNHSDKIRIQWSSLNQLEIFSEGDVVMAMTNYQGVVIHFTKSK